MVQGDNLLEATQGRLQRRSCPQVQQPSSSGVSVQRASTPRKEPISPPWTAHRPSRALCVWILPQPRRVPSWGWRLLSCPHLVACCPQGSPHTETQVIPQDTQAHQCTRLRASRGPTFQGSRGRSAQTRQVWGGASEPVSHSGAQRCCCCRTWSSAASAWGSTVQVCPSSAPPNRVPDVRGPR